MDKLALLGGTPAITHAAPEVFKWPIITEEDEAAALDVIRNNKFSGTDITEKFQDEFASWLGAKYALAFCNGTATLSAAMYAIGLGAGDEIICPTKTYWGSVSQAINFGATAVFCNIDDHLSMDPDDIERCISPKTKAIVVVHYFAYPADMDRIMAIARKYNLKVIEDVSHAQGGLYKGKRLGTFGDIGAMSLMSWKSFAAGEMGMMVTDKREYFERAIAYGHYERNNSKFIQECEDLLPYSHIALGGIKGRANQLCSALGRVQLKYYDERCAEIRRAMNYFWDQLEGVKGIRAIRVDESTGSNMAGWYSPHGLYVEDEMDGLPVGKFCEAVRAEGFASWDGGNFCLHTHPFFKSFDFYNLGKPSRILYADRDVRPMDAACEPSEHKLCFSVPWFKKFDKAVIEEYAYAFRKVAENHMQLIDPESAGKGQQSGRWYGTENA